MQISHSISSLLSTVTLSCSRPSLVAASVLTQSPDSATPRRRRGVLARVFPSLSGDGSTRPGGSYIPMPMVMAAAAGDCCCCCFCCWWQCVYLVRPRSSCSYSWR
ncbi:hypothetical protein DFH27DRAFT_572953 [Peziza echinospora]|nr:hypothetical protein DFH27DRAFT_572953 [Peziza echinospora]